MDIKTFLGGDVKEPEAIAMLEFFQAFEPSTDAKLWIVLIEEEIDEVKEAIEVYKADKTSENKAALLKEVCDLRYVLVGMNAVMVPHFVNLFRPDSPVLASLKAADEFVTDIAEDFPVAFPMEILIEAFFRVHGSNLSKLDDDGNPIRREDGKIMKGPNYAAPDLSDLVEG